MTAASLLRCALAADQRDDEPAWEWLREHGMPTNADESWRYTALEQVFGGEYRTDPSSSSQVDRELVAAAGEHGGPRVVLVDGAIDRELSDVAALPAGIRIAWGPGDDDPLARRYDGFRALNRLAGCNQAEVHVARGTRIEVPVHIVHATDARRAPINHPRTSVRVGRDAEVSVIETYLGTAGPSLTNAVTSLAVEQDGHLRHHKVLLGATEGSHIAHTTMSLERGARADHWSVLTSALTARNAIDVLLAGDGAAVHLRGLDLLDGAQRHDTAVTVEHAASHGTSRQLYRSAIDDHARSAFGGRVIVGHGTAGNDADQSSRSLLLAPSAQADSRPWLEIFADDVRCTHGSSIGRLNADALFYLRARGIPHLLAKSMLVGGFIAEMTETIEVASLRALVTSIIQQTRHGGAAA